MSGPSGKSQGKHATTFTCPHCGKPLFTEVSADAVIERYYRVKAAGGKTNLRRLAKETGYNYSYLRDVKAAYDKRGGWGSKKKMSDAPDIVAED